MANSYVCNRDIFQHIYRLEKRRSGRRRYYSYLTQIKLEERKDNNIKKASQGIEEILSERLRSGDVVCKWNNNHFVLILNNVDDNGVSKVMKRIRDHFFKNINEPGIDLTIQYLPIT